MNQQRHEVVEQIAMTVRDRKLRLLGLAAPQFDPGTSQLVREVAQVLARAGISTLLVDMTGGRGASSADASGTSWVPKAAATTAKPATVESGFDVIAAASGAAARAAFNDPQRLRDSLLEQFPKYAMILLDLPALVDHEAEYLNGVAGAAAADGVLMVCVMGEVEQATVERAVDLVRTAGGKLQGTVIDDRRNPPLRIAMARPVMKYSRFVPIVGEWLAAWLLRRRILRTEIHT
jgi:Mrp family chromosome partitioning ATPase